MIRLTDDAWEPPTLRLIPIAARLDAGFSETDPHISWEAEVEVFRPCAVGHRLPICTSSTLAQGELDRSAAETIAKFLVWMGGLP